jgi:hypothetical protein
MMSEALDTLAMIIIVALAFAGIVGLIFALMLVAVSLWSAIGWMTILIFAAFGAVVWATFRVTTP